MTSRKRGQIYFSRDRDKAKSANRKINLSPFSPFSSRAVYELAPDLLLVFKPRGHLELEHAHDYNQRVRLIRGKLEIRYATRALLDTWLIVEKLPRAARGDA